MTAVIVALFAALGLAIGSFLNVVIWRVPRGESVVRPPSACPGCGRKIRARDNVPVLSWLLLRARCRDCRAPISAQYPVVELLTGVLFVLVLVRFGLTWELPGYLYGAAIGVALTVIDLKVHRLPNAIVLPSYIVVSALLLVAAIGTGDWSALLRAGIGGVVLYAAYFLMCLAYPAGMGFGDVKLAALIGAYLGWIGWGALAIGAFGAFLLGGAFSLVLIVLRRAGRKSGIPFGPWMILGAACGIAFGEQIWSSYLSAVM
ncbi:leader peptidase (prepilin peptidase) / N-methyltransferase [Sanguibacter gelidistatuariae]|uniref:Prepilin leader peptidase/N-methyltransferase n=1 Tax=Sanguibacter gelidistatuariae TaxID=1814289 RepID=A0A1G6JSE9_9MICO|nr:A24 family peptidase [Sanguibacter gelidistatuariae]SDC21355.1 leader peptidase (prepilin peptidase) / N-methyltransferase [Sanguibacter gelidistatuariae]